tara:strand:- start:52 stop:1290 length:1239 start_codon:yes stop_codon:yes gene_type:complete
MNTPPVIELREYEKRTDIDLQLDEKDHELIKELEQKGILKISRGAISGKLKFEASSQIGVAQFTNFTVTVNPKFTNIENLVKLINYVYDLDIDILPESEVKFRNESDMLTEIIISSFLNQCKNLIRQGLYKSYVIHQERNMPCLRGKLLLVQQLQNDARKNAKFACEFDELEYNNLENQILLYCLHKCSDWTIIDSKKNELHSLIQQISPLVNYKQITIEHFKKINYTRLNQYYDKIHQLCKIIVQNIGISDFYEQKTSFVNSFFVDMNNVFENFFFKLIKQYHPLPSKEQVPEVSWRSTLGQTFTNKPDILIYDETRTSVKYILDTKYKTEIAQSDIRQLADYMGQQGKNDAYAILPKTENSRPDEHQAENRDVIVKVRYIDIDKAIHLIYTRDSSIRKEKIRELFEEIIN